jgi:hypothetical protein
MNMETVAASHTLTEKQLAELHVIPKEPIRVYGMPMWHPVEQRPLTLAEIEYARPQIELLAWLQKRLPEDGGLGPATHLQNAAALFFPNRVLHPWTVWRMQRFCEYDVCVYDGCAASGKTADSALLAFLYWLADPVRTIVVLVSTTAVMARRRVWSEISNLYYSNPFMAQIGRMIESRMTVASYVTAPNGERQPSNRYGIYVLAVEEGVAEKVLAQMKGLHAPRMMLVMDEGDEIREEVLAVTSNWRGGCRELKIISSSNPVAWATPHGMLAEPALGRSHVTAQTEEWETKGIPKWFIPPGIALRFDALKSPNLIAGKTIYPFLPTKEYVEEAAKAEGHGEDSIFYWRYLRGLRRPEGRSRVVFTERMIEEYDGKGKLTFVDTPKIIAALDPAYGGDECILQFALLGRLNNGQQGIQLTETLVVPITVGGGSKNRQIAEFVKARCEERNCPPSHLIVDVSGEGRGAADMIDEIWDKGLVDRCHFADKPSDALVDVMFGKQRRAREVYDRKVTELYYTVRKFLMAGVLKGFTDKQIVEFANREYQGDELKVVKLESKEKYRERFHHSPDRADACALICEKAKRMGMTGLLPSELRIEEKWAKLAEEYEKADAAMDYQDDPIDVEALI